MKQVWNSCCVAVVLKKKPLFNFALPMRSILFRTPAVLMSFSLFVLALQAQEDPRADELLANVSAHMRQFSSVHASYTSKMIDRQSDLEMDQAGEVWVSEDRYHLQLGDYVIVSDGETVWTYEPEMGECYIDDAEAIAEDGVDPARMFTIWEEGFRKVWKGETEVEGKNMVRIDLHPTGADERSFHTIQCFIDAAALEVGMLVVKGREGTDVEYRIGTFEGDALVPDGAFTFDKARYPGTTMIDNRL